MSAHPVSGSIRTRIQDSWLPNLSYWICTSYFWLYLVEFLIKDHPETFLDLWALVYLNPSPGQFTTLKSQASKIKYWEDHAGKYNFPWWNSKAIMVFFSFMESLFKYHCLPSIRKACAPCMRQDEAGICSVTECRTVPDVYFLFTWWNVLSGAFGKRLSIQFRSVRVSCSVMPDSLRSHGPQHARLPCPSQSPGACSNSCPLCWWCHPTISSSVIPFSSCLQSFPASGSFPMSQFFASGGQRIGVSASASVLPMNIQDWFPLGLNDLISLQSKGLSRVFSNTTVQKPQFFGTQI